MIFFFVLTAWSCAVLAKSSPGQLLRRQGRQLQDGNFQPSVITVEKNQKAMGSIGFPEGSIWCNHKPGVWLVGHHNHEETPYCLQGNDNVSNFTNFDYSGSVWARTSPAHFDLQDILNEPSGPARGIDRHDCTTLDVNGDGFMDVVCGVGADAGRGEGFNELYLTDPSNGSLYKVLQGHGLHKYPSMRNRKTVTLKSADGASLVFMATQGARRDDLQPNNHRMFRLDQNSTHSFFFNEVDGPWIRHTRAECLRVVDVNQDGIDDLLMCDDRPSNPIYLQNSDTTWSEIKLRGSRRSRGWLDARIADVTGDGIVDLVVVGEWKKRNYLRVFKGMGVAPFFDIENRSGMIYQSFFPHLPSAIEVVDINSDGIYDIYVVQVDDETEGSYCKEPFIKDNWRGNNGQGGIVAGPDLGKDFLFVGDPSSPGSKYQKIEMQHEEPGCGSLVEQFGSNRTLLLAQGTMERWGNNLLLQW